LTYKDEFILALFSTWSFDPKLRIQLPSRAAERIQIAAMDKRVGKRFGSIDIDSWKQQICHMSHVTNGLVFEGQLGDNLQFPRIRYFSADYQISEPRGYLALSQNSVVLYKAIQGPAATCRSLGASSFTAQGSNLTVKRLSTVLPRKNCLYGSWKMPFVSKFLPFA